MAIIGGGPAGLMAADVLSAAGCRVTLYEAMPTVARKLLMAGKSGLNITHAEDYECFVTRYGDAGERLRPALDRFTPQDVRDWAEALGQETFTGTSGRVFPLAMKASPLLRAWLARLERQGVQIMTRHRWCGFAGEGAGEGQGERLRLAGPDGIHIVKSAATLLALGGASWPRLGSDALWVPQFTQKGVTVRPFRPANCGFDLAWSAYFRDRFAGTPLKSVAVSAAAGRFTGEFVITRHGIEGSLVYAHSAALRDGLETAGGAVLSVDLAPGRSLERLGTDLGRSSGKDSLANRLRKAAGLSPVKAALLREVTADLPHLPPAALAGRIKALPLTLLAARPLAEAISSAGGVAWAEIDAHFMLKALPGLFVAGEMLDWEAPTGGYLLTVCLATGAAAAHGILNWLEEQAADQ